MFKIWVDKDNYYTENFIENETHEVDVENMPNGIKNAEELTAYKYNSQTNLLEVDEDKLTEIATKMAKEKITPTQEERLSDLEQAFLELSNMVLKGGDIK